jgi:hypothetical protein
MQRWRGSRVRAVRLSNHRRRRWRLGAGRAGRGVAGRHSWSCCRADRALGQCQPFGASETGKPQLSRMGSHWPLHQACSFVECFPQFQIVHPPVPVITRIVLDHIGRCNGVAIAVLRCYRSEVGIFRVAGVGGPPERRSRSDTDVSSWSFSCFRSSFTAC